MPAGSSPKGATGRRVDSWKIITWVGLLLAGALYMVDPLEWLSSPVVLICFVATEPDTPTPATIEISGTSVSAIKDERSAQLFGMETGMSHERSRSSSWTIDGEG